MRRTGGGNARRLASQQALGGTGRGHLRAPVLTASLQPKRSPIGQNACTPLEADGLARRRAARSSCTLPESLCCHHPICRRALWRLNGHRSLSRAARRGPRTSSVARGPPISLACVKTKCRAETTKARRGPLAPRTVARSLSPAHLLNAERGTFFCRPIPQKENPAARRHRRASSSQVPRRGNSGVGLTRRDRAT